MKISFCTTCCNRLHQFRQTFESNIEIISQNEETEWVIADLSSDDGLHEFMMARLPSLPPRVIYAVERRKRPWHMSIAKNIAHRLGSCGLLMNLDCDNFIHDTLDLVRGPFSRGVKAIHLWSGAGRDGTSGRIVVERNVFYRLGGYDESFYPVGFEELDLLRRACKSGAPVEHRPCASSAALANTKEESIKYCDLRGFTWDQCAVMNKQTSDNNLAMNRLTANVGQKWGDAQMELFRGGIGPNSSKSRYRLSKRKYSHL